VRKETFSVATGAGGGLEHQEVGGGCGSLLLHQPSGGHPQTFSTLSSPLLHTCVFKEYCNSWHCTC